MKFSSSILFLGCWMAGQWCIVTGLVYPIPTIQVAPSSVIPFGGSFNITCNVRNEGRFKFDYVFSKLKFTLYKEEAGLIMVKAQNVSVYFKHNAKLPEGGSYKCEYCHPANCSLRCSWTSNTVDVIIRDQSLLKPSISILGVPFVNGSAVIQCEGMKNDLNVTLQRFSNPISVIETNTNTSTAEFHFSPLKVEDGGRYTCEYRPRENRFVLSMTSDPLELNLTDSSLPKPTLKLRPEESTLGWSVTIECQGPESGLNFTLQRPNNLMSLWLMESTGNSTKFSLAQVRLEDEGNYTCCYHHRDHPFVWSEPSEPVLLVVRALSTAEVGIRLTIAILVLLATLLIAAEAVYSSNKEAASRSPPE